jgi:allantoinase
VTLPADYLEYPRRRRGMDQGWYEWTDHFRRPPVVWPGGGRVALWIVPSLESFPLTPASGAVRAPGGMVTPYPDLRHFTSRDYGNRVGVGRVLEVLDQLDLRASFACNVALAERYPHLMRRIVARGDEIIAHGIDMNHVHTSAMPVEEEDSVIARSLEVLGSFMDRPVQGWLSPARSQSGATLGLLAGRGVRYVGDLVNDELPYRIRTEQGDLMSLPVSCELSDRKILVELCHSAEEYAQQLIDAFDWLYAESERFGGRLLCIPVTPYITGLPYRIEALRAALAHISRHSGVWSATGAEILAAWVSQFDQTGAG